MGAAEAKYCVAVTKESIFVPRRGGRGEGASTRPGDHPADAGAKIGQKSYSGKGGLLRLGPRSPGGRGDYSAAIAEL